MKNKYLSISLFFLVLFGFTACEKVIELDIPAGERFVVIESQITNLPGFWTVSLSYSQPYFDQEKKQFPENALVKISDQIGNEVTLQHDTSGVYVSSNEEACVVGRIYTLTVEVDGKTYKASEQCRFQEPIDFLMAFNLPVRNGFIDPGWYVFEKADEAEGDGDYYQWKIYNGDTLKDDFGLILDSDEFRESSFFNINIDPDDPLKGQDQNILPRPFPFRFEPLDTVTVEQYSITKEYYEFLLEFSNQQNRSGTPFDPPPANPNTNIEGGAFGYFSVANVSRDSVVIE